MMATLTFNELIQLLKYSKSIVKDICPSSFYTNTSSVPGARISKSHNEIL